MWIYILLLAAKGWERVLLYLSLAGLYYLHLLVMRTMFKPRELGLWAVCQYLLGVVILLPMLRYLFPVPGYLDDYLHCLEQTLLRALSILFFITFLFVLRRSFYLKIVSKYLDVLLDIGKYFPVAVSVLCIGLLIIMWPVIRLYPHPFLIKFAPFIDAIVRNILMEFISSVIVIDVIMIQALIMIMYAYKRIGKPYRMLVVGYAIIFIVFAILAYFIIRNMLIY